MDRRPRLLAISTLALAAIAALVVFGLSSSHSTAGRAPGAALPRERLAGPPVTLASALARAHGRATLVTFWASWCGPCAHEAPALERFSRRPAGRGRARRRRLERRAVGRTRVRRKHAWTFPILRDAEGTVGNDYRLTGLPTTFVLDASGRIRAVLRGPQDASSLAKAMASVTHA